MSREIHIPFRAKMRAALAADRKSMTSRFIRYGDPGDWFVVDGRTYILRSVNRVLLGYVAEHWREEGCDSQEDFWSVWKSIYPNRASPGLMVWLHEFEPDPGAK